MTEDEQREQQLREVIADTPLSDEDLTPEQEERLRRHLEQLRDEPDEPSAN